jgi:NAD(P)-dependent dehydrogenase (short-subunit alcohol dehydrogenase family)
MDLGLGDRVAFVTGASGGIGQALVGAFLAEGARVAAHA